MSLRDYFAAAVVHGVTSNKHYLDKVGEYVPVDEDGHVREDRDRARYEFVARQAYAMADAMLKARAVREEGA